MYGAPSLQPAQPLLWGSDCHPHQYRGWGGAPCCSARHFWLSSRLCHPCGRPLAVLRHQACPWSSSDKGNRRSHQNCEDLLCVCSA